MRPTRPSRRLLFSLLGLCACILPVSQQAHAAYPEKPITFIVPFPAGGGVDLVGRILAERIGAQSGASIVVDNRGGAGGTIGVASAARSAPDGYTVSLGSPGNISIAPSIYPKLQYDPAKDLAPVAMAVQMPILVLSRPDAPFKNVSELIAHAKTNPGTLSYGSGGTGTSQHLAGALFANLADIDVLHVPYKGSSPALVDLMGGRIDFMFIDTSAMSAVTSGRANLLAVTNTERSPLLPETPTVAESGLPGYEASNWYGFFLPAGANAQTVQWLNEQITKAMQDPSVQEKLKGQMLLAAPAQTPDEFRQFILDDIAKWKQVVGTLDLSK